MVAEMREWETMFDPRSRQPDGPPRLLDAPHGTARRRPIDRIMDSCPPAQQNQVRRQLALVLKGHHLHAALSTRVDGKGLVPVVEIRAQTRRRSRSKIETGETKDINEEIESSVLLFQDAVE